MNTLEEKKNVPLRKYQLVFTITSKCNITCRHCCANSSDFYLPDPQSEDMNRWLLKLPQQNTICVSFGGGEPFLKYNDLKKYCEILDVAGISAFSLTNAYWGGKKEKAVKILSDLKGLAGIIISIDQYHQEHISEEIIHGAIEAAFEAGKKVVLNLTYSDDQEKSLERSKYEKYLGKVLLVENKIMSYGSARDLKYSKYNLRDNPEKIDASCAIGDLFVNQSGAVYHCCPTANLLKDSENPFYLGSIDNDGWEVIFENADTSNLLKSVLKNGPQVLIDVFKDNPDYDELLDVEFFKECDICFYLLKNEKYRKKLNDSF